MAVYVDNMKAVYGRMKMCHMIADSTDELLAMADAIGVARKWIQKANTHHEHFDICLNKRAEAVKAGAIEISMTDLGRMLRKRLTNFKKLSPVLYMAMGVFMESKAITIDFYYQIKAKSNDRESFSNWSFPPVFSGKVTADSKKSAKIIIEEEYGRNFPLRVLEKDLEKEHYLLSIQEIKADDERTKGLFDFRDCQQCGQRFRIIDLYNDHNEIYKGKDYCGHHCRELHRLENIGDRGEWWNRNARPIIYQITNINTGLSYIGNHTSFYFTLVSALLPRRFM